MLELRAVTDGEFAEWVRVEARAYGNRLTVEPEALRPPFRPGAFHRHIR